MMILRLCLLALVVLMCMACAGRAPLEKTVVDTVSPALTPIAESSQAPDPMKTSESIWPVLPADQKVIMGEIWAYVMQDEEAAYNSRLPVTDIGYFAAEINSTGDLRGIPDRARIKTDKVRVHLVCAQIGNYALSHLVLNPAYPKREQLIKGLVRASENFDGLQIDFESVLDTDKQSFLSFMSELKRGIGKRILSVAIPARTAKTTEPFDYAALASICDRIIIMAYDEHWSGSKPGSVASLDWCAKVASFALTQIPVHKLVMGLPFYGRSWTDKSLAKAYRHGTVSQIMKDLQLASYGRVSEVPFFEYAETVKVKVYFEDAYSNFVRSSLYRDRGVQRIAFWRLGQEDAAVWKHFGIGADR